MQRWIAAGVLCVCSGQLGSAAQSKQTTKDNLYTPRFHGAISVRALGQDPHAATFTLSTSWIPGPTGNGVMRYRIHGSIDRKFDHQQTKAVADGKGSFVEVNPDKVYNDQIADALVKLRTCNFYLVLLDDAGFKLREIPVPFIGSVDVYDSLDGLDANDSIPMSSEEYRHVITPDSSWNLEWSGCPKD